MAKPIQTLIASRFPLSGQALLSRLSEDAAKYRAIFRECLSREPLPDDFRPQIVILNCVDRCVFGSPSNSVLYPFAKCVAVCRGATLRQQALWLRVGVHGIIDETQDSFEVLERAIQSVLGGDIWVGRKVLAEFLVTLGRIPNTWDGLDFRERELMMLLRLGCSNASIARRLRLSEKTVKWHLTNVYRKLDVRGRTQATLRFLQLQKEAFSIPQP